MIDLIEVFDRADQGLLISDTDYYMGRFVPKLAEVILRHGIQWDKKTIVNTDDDLADRVFQAAIDLLAETGVYCTDTSRVMDFTRDEILRAVEQSPRQTKFGEGREAKTMYGVIGVKVWIFRDKEHERPVSPRMGRRARG